MLKQIKSPKQLLIWVVFLLLLLIILFNVWLLIEVRSFSTFPQNSISSAIQLLDKPALETEKLRQEVNKLMLENNRLNNAWYNFSSYAALLTAIVAVSGVFLTIWKQFDERQKDREQREFESRRHFDEIFNSIITNISSDNLSLQMSSAVSLFTFLKPEYYTFHEQVYLILLANLKLKLDQQVNDLLVKVFEKALRIRLSASQRINQPLKWELSHTNLYRIDLSGLDLEDIDIGFADLRRANLKDANLFRIRGIEANLANARLSRSNLGEARLVRANLSGAYLHATNLIAATLKETNLNEAQFYQAKMQSANLKNAILTGARFEQANLNDTYFTGAKFDQKALCSILKAENWDKAHFDENVTANLKEMISQL
jgi:uncharacterized protein YjbI with pentapeptide repeats